MDMCDVLLSKYDTDKVRDPDTSNEKNIIIFNNLENSGTVLCKNMRKEKIYYLELCFISFVLKYKETCVFECTIHDNFFCDHT